MIKILMIVTNMLSGSISSQIVNAQECEAAMKNVEPTIFRVDCVPLILAQES